MGPIFPIVTLGFALFFSAIPLPLGHQHWMPAWLSLVAFWLVLHQPRYMTVLIAWAVGLVFDLILGAPLSSSAFGLAVAVYLAGLFRLRLRHLAIAQQLVACGAFVLVALQIALLIRVMVGLQAHPMPILITVLTSVSCWPVLALGLSSIARRINGEAL